MSNALTNIVPPPKSPATAPRSWKDVESELGAAFPDDVKWLADTYGEGLLAGFFRLRDPRQPEYPAWSKEVRAATRESGVQVDAALVPIAHTDNGDTLWVGADRVVVTEGRGPERDEVTGTLTSFLAQVLTRQHECPVFPDDVASGPIQFEPRVRVSQVVATLYGDGSFADHKPSFVAIVTDANAPAGKAKVLKDKAWIVQIEKGRARFSLSALDGGDLELSLTFHPEDEAAVRAIARVFRDACQLKVSSIKRQNEPIWPEAL